MIGAGTAGLTAAIYARRASKSVLVLEARGFGGQILNTPAIWNYPAEPGISGFDFAMKLYSQAETLGAEFAFGTASGFRAEDGGFTVPTADAEYRGRSLIIATGTSHRGLGLPGEEALTGRGVSFCATCDGALYKGRDVAVVGGGNTAVSDALYLSDLAATVWLIHRRDSFRADPADVALLGRKENIRLLLGTRVTGLVAEDKLSAVVLTGPEGRTSELPVAGLFIAVGMVPATGAFEGLLELDPSGYIVAGEDCRTSVPGVFAAGDGRTKDVRQLVTAAADGAVAATAAVRYVNSL